MSDPRDTVIADFEERFRRLEKRYVDAEKQRDILAAVVRNLKQQSLFYCVGEEFTHDFPATVHDLCDDALHEAGMEDA